ncbi:hypothetical protein D7Y21_02550 [Corallococcus sp. AB045]|uniref:hypothetical protein n=1 Tax=Corallococcus sp. AB045 TaxID=2316719 RepID=UPI000EC3FA23|nr:hypothetical protein [Corallococcus sp. AB045]RKH91470.1 hypothetical protein D7Y21_02550 [Corallococcus sp. AB045]
MTRLQCGMGLVCLLLGASASATEPDIRARFKTDYRAQGFEQISADSAYARDELPAEGALAGPYLRLLGDVTQTRNNFKFASWVLCVSPTSEEDGTVLLIDSVNLIKEPEQNGPELIVSYRRVKTPGNPKSRGWPYALLIVRGWHEKVRCVSTG